jgi:two-component sensor histidine kinase
LTHDLKGPLAAIMGYAELLADPEYGDIAPQKVEYAQKIRRVGNVMLMQINNVVQLARLEKGEVELNLEDVQMEALCSELENTFGYMARHSDVSLVFYVASGLAVRADRQYLLLVLQNLLHNALRHTSAGGAIEVSAVMLSDELASVAVSNTGSFIAPEEQGLLFRKFGRLRGGQEGSGLGLYVCRRVMQLHGTDIHVESDPAAGTRFFCTVPVRRRGACRVLLVGAQAEAEMLAAHGMDVDEAAGGMECLQAVRVERPDVIVLRSDLPDLTPDDVAQGLEMDPSTRPIPLLLIGNGAPCRRARMVAEGDEALLAAIHEAVG